MIINQIISPYFLLKMKRNVESFYTQLVHLFGRHLSSLVRS